MIPARVVRGVSTSSAMADPKAEGAIREAANDLADLAKRWQAAAEYLKIADLRARHETLSAARPCRCGSRGI
jgi:hypothetical protein